MIQVFGEILMAFVIFFRELWWVLLLLAVLGALTPKARRYYGSRRKKY